jgi:hypothetical protein
MAPAGSTVHIAAPDVVAAQRLRAAARPVTDPTATPVRVVDGDHLWPLRGKDVIAEVRDRLGKAATFNSHDMLCVRTVHDIETEHPEFMYRPFAMAAPQYSIGYVDWLTRSWKADKEFFKKARKVYKSM